MSRGSHAARGGGLGEAADRAVPGDGVRDAGGGQGAQGPVRFCIHDDHPRLEHMSFDAMWSALEPSAGTRAPAATGGSPGPARTRPAGVVRRRGRRAWPGPHRGPRRQPVGVVGRPRRRGGGRPAGAGPRLAPGLACPTAAPSTARSASCQRLRRARCAARQGVPRRPGRSASSTSPTRRARGSASPAPGRGCITGALDADRARGAARRRRRHAWPRRCAAAGRDPAPARPRRRDAAAGSARSSSCTSSRAAASSTSTARSRSASAIWPHGRWRLDFAGEANHAGTTRLEDRHDPMLGAAPRPSLAARAAAQRARLRRDRRQGRGRARRRQRHPVARSPAWLDARGAGRRRRAPRSSPTSARRRAAGAASRGVVDAGDRASTPALAARPRRRARRRAGAGAPAPATTPASSPTPGVPTAMLFVRNPTGVSHSPAEHAEPRRLPRGRRGADARSLAELAG